MYTHTASMTGRAIMNRTMKSVCWPLAEDDIAPGGTCGPTAK